MAPRHVHSIVSRADIFNSAGAFAQHWGLASDAFVPLWIFLGEISPMDIIEHDGFWKNT